MALISAVSIWLIPLIIGFILLYGTFKRIPTYEAFVEGGKEGIEISFSIIPYLVGMLVAVSVFRASGALDFFMDMLKPIFRTIHVPTEIVPLALIRPISGTASLGIMSDLISIYGADSLIGRIASTMQGSTDTTLYVITVYFGAVGIKRMGDAIKVGLLADFAAIIFSVVIVTILFN